MKKTFAWFVVIGDGTISDEIRSPSFVPGELGAIFGRMAQTAQQMREEFLARAPAEDAELFEAGYQELIKGPLPDGVSGFVPRRRPGHA